MNRETVSAATGLADHGNAGGERCDLCGGPTVEVRCKIVCRNCGYTRDCSDP